MVGRFDEYKKSKAKLKKNIGREFKPHLCKNCGGIMVKSKTSSMMAEVYGKRCGCERLAQNRTTSNWWEGISEKNKKQIHDDIIIDIQLMAKRIALKYHIAGDFAFDIVLEKMGWFLDPKSFEKKSQRISQKRKGVSHGN